MSPFRARLGTARIRTMGGSALDVLWTVCYLSVLIGLSGYGLHRYFIVYLFLKNRDRPPQPLAHFDELPVVTVQLPIFNEIYVVERLLNVGQRARLSARPACRSRCWMIRPTRPAQ